MNKYLVWCPERDQGPEEGKSIHAFEEEAAAAEWGEHDDAYSAEYSIVSGREVTVMVRDEGGQESSFVVSGESKPIYFARPVAAKTAKGDAQ